MKDNNDSKKNLFNESQKENDDPMKSETLLLKSSRVSNIEKEKYQGQIKEKEKEKENQTTNNNLQFKKLMKNLLQDSIYLFPIVFVFLVVDFNGFHLLLFLIFLFIMNYPNGKLIFFI